MNYKYSPALAALSLIAATTSAHAANSFTPYTDQIEEQIAAQPPKDIDEFLSTLPEEMRSLYLLVYDSSSLQSASPARPRVILHTPDHQFFLAFADENGTAVADQTVEIIEAYGINPPKFTQISWDGGKAQVNRNPEVCATCHQGAHILESYPEWPGFFGSSHDGRGYGEVSGSSQMPRFEFEENALVQFRQNAPLLPRYRQLLALDQVTISSQGIRNSMAGTVIADQLHQRQANQVFESASSISDLHDAYVMSWPFKTYDGATMEMWPEITGDPRFADYRAFIAQNSDAYASEAARAASRKFDSFAALVQSYGTDGDKKWFNQARPFSSLEPYRGEYQPYPPILSALGLNFSGVMNYFENRDGFRMPGLFYLMWLSKHPEAEALPMNNGLDKSNVHFLTGFSFGALLTNLIAGADNAFDYGAPFSMRNYRDFSELYEWVPLPLKQYTWDEISQDAVLAAAFDKVQKAYLDIIRGSPQLKIQAPVKFRDLISWSPENLAALEALISAPPR